MLVRQVLSGMAEAIDLDANDLYEISVAVTEDLHQRCGPCLPGR